MTILPPILILAFLLASLTLAKSRPAILARSNGTLVFNGLQTALMLAGVAFLCWQFFTIGFQTGGDIARRDARAEAKAAASMNAAQSQV